MKQHIEQSRGAALGVFFMVGAVLLLAALFFMSISGWGGLTGL